MICFILGVSIAGYIGYRIGKSLWEEKPDPDGVQNDIGAVPPGARK